MTDELEERRQRLAARRKLWADAEAQAEEMVLEVTRAAYGDEAAKLLADEDEPIEETP